MFEPFVRAFRVVQLASCVLMFATGIAAALSVEWFAEIAGSTIGGWIWDIAFVLTLAFLAEMVFWMLRRMFGAKLDDLEPIPTEVPVTGDWQALNSPANRVPSHGIRWGGQSHAIDIITSGPKPRFGASGFNRPQEFAAFDAPIFAPVEGTVVRTVDARRDHRARNGVLGLIFLLIEQVMLSFLPPSFTFGNNIVLELAPGRYAQLCHLRRGSLNVEPGDRVHIGQQLARCGNSGNSTQPHLHFQLMDSLSPNKARGLPFTWTDLGVPGNGDSFTAPA